MQVQTDAIKCSLCRAIFVRFNGVIPGCHCPLWSLKRKPTETAGKWIFINVVMVMVRPFDQSPWLSVCLESRRIPICGWCLGLGVKMGFSCWYIGKWNYRSAWCNLVRISPYMQTYKTNLYLYLYLYIHMYVHEISVSCIIPNVPKVSYQTESSFPASISNFNSVSLHSLAELQFLYWCRLSVQLSPYSDAPPLSERFVWNHIMAIFPSLWTLLFQALTMSPSRSFQEGLDKQLLGHSPQAVQLKLRLEVDAADPRLLRHVSAAAQHRENRSIFQSGNRWGTENMCL